MIKIGVVTDLHANLPALKAFLAAAKDEGFDALYHLGDAIAIGPNPRECVDLILSTPGMHVIRGNHESYYLDGILEPRPIWMSDGEVLHQTWVSEQLGLEYRKMLAAWPWMMDVEFAGVSVRFQHYALDASGRDFAPMLRDPAAAELEAHFGSPDAQLVCYGHAHQFTDLKTKTRLINPGSLGCQREAVAPYLVLEFVCGSYKVEHHHIPYDDRCLYQDFEERKVPERAFLYDAFFGGRFPPS